MKKGLIKKIFAVSLVGMMALGMMACGENDKDNSSNNDGQSVQEESKDSFDQIKEKGKLVVGLSADYAPYEFHKVIDGKDEIVGFDVEIAKEIAKELNVELELKDMKFGSLVGALPAGHIDMIISGMTPDEERKKQVDFSDVYYNATHGVIVRKDDVDKYKDEASLAEVKIGAQMGAIQAELAAELTEEKNVVLLGSVGNLIADLKGKKIEGVVVELPVAEQIIKSNSDLVIAPFEIKDEEGGSAIAVRKESPKLLESVNKVIKKLIDDGDLDKFIIEAQKLSE